MPGCRAVKRLEGFVISLLGAAFWGNILEEMRLCDFTAPGGAAAALSQSIRY